MIIHVSLSSQDDIHQKTLEDTGFWGKQAAGCLFVARSTKRLLFAHRSADVLEPHTWGTWGGALDEHETPQQCVLREAHEEAGYRDHIDLLKMSVFSHSSGFKYHTFLAVVDYEFTPKMNWETQDFAWIEFGKWPRNLHPGLRVTLAEAKNVAFIRRTLDSL